MNGEALAREEPVVPVLDLVCTRTPRPRIESPLRPARAENVALGCIAVERTEVKSRPLPSDVAYLEQILSNRAKITIIVAVGAGIGVLILGYR